MLARLAQGFSRFSAADVFVVAGRSRAFASSESVPVTSNRSSGAGIFQRISSFLVGAGLTALGTHFYIWDELWKSNKLMIEKQMEHEKRLSKLEKK